VLKSKLGSRPDAWIRAALPFLFRRPVSPHLLTGLGVGVGCLSAFAFANGRFVAGALLLGLCGICDLVDGVVARHHGLGTRFGAFLDSTLDRFVDMVVLLGIAMHYARVGEPEHVLLAGWTLVASVLVSYAKAAAERVGAEIDVGLLERAERVVILGLGALVGLLIPALWVVAIGSTITVVQRFVRAHREIGRSERHESETRLAGDVSEGA